MPRFRIILGLAKAFVFRFDHINLFTHKSCDAYCFQTLSLSLSFEIQPVERVGSGQNSRQRLSDQPSIDGKNHRLCDETEF